jgi:hypothetical protein
MQANAPQQADFILMILQARAAGDLTKDRNNSLFSIRVGYIRHAQAPLSIRYFGETCNQQS